MIWLLIDYAAGGDALFAFTSREASEGAAALWNAYISDGLGDARCVLAQEG